MVNPLVGKNNLPPFDMIQAEHVVPAMEALIGNARDVLSQVLAAGVADWESVVTPLEEAQDAIDQAWSTVSHLNAVANNEALRTQYEIAQEKLTEYYAALGQNRALFDLYSELDRKINNEDLPQAKKQMLKHTLRGFRLSGIDLSTEQQAEFKAIKSELSSLTTKFSNNVLDATKGWSKHLEDVEALAGLPDFLVEGARAQAKSKNLTGYILSLDLPVYFTVMSQSDNQALRKEMYLAYQTRASDVGPSAGQWSNTGLIDDILGLRKRQAGLLGFNNFAEYSLATKMAESPEGVLGFLKDLALKSKPFAEQELAELKAFAANDYSVDVLNAWDIPYYSEKLKLKNYAVSQETLRPYFPLEKVKAGLFDLVHSLYGVVVRRREDVPLWNKDAEFYDVFRGEAHIASFFLDLYARADKRGGAWMAECRNRRRVEDGIQIPVAYLTCNFNAPVGDQPALITHNEVTTLFHEFGHGLHHMMTKVDVAAVSGINGVEWDAVELPSQFMENFCWQKSVLNKVSEHYETGESLPETLLQNLLAAKNFQSAMQMLRQLEFALFDLNIHMGFGNAGFSGVQECLDQVRSDIAVLIPPPEVKFQNGFSHIFAGGYAAGYYSYKWAEILSADVFAAFEEEGVFNPATGERFLTEILERGGSEGASVLFERFRGRPPSAEALMRHSGLKG